MATKKTETKKTPAKKNAPAKSEEAPKKVGRGVAVVQLTGHPPCKLRGR